MATDMYVHVSVGKTYTYSPCRRDGAREAVTWPAGARVPADRDQDVQVQFARHATPHSTCRPAGPRRPHVARTRARLGHVISHARTAHGETATTQLVSRNRASSLIGAAMSTGMRPGRRFTVGRSEDATHPDTIRAAISEFLATAIFVFAAEGSYYALLLLTHSHAAVATAPNDMSTAGGLVSVALAHALALAAAVAVAVNISGGHVNPAITFGALIGGRISLIRAVFYWVAQLLGAIAATLLLRLATGGARPPGFALASGVGDWHAVLLEAAMTFGLMYAYYATVIDPKRGHVGTVAPLAVGFMLGANVLAGGPFDGAGMNPARVFGPALVGWRWRHHWVYWLGPFIGAGLAGLVYEYLVIPRSRRRTTDKLAAARRTVTAGAVASPLREPGKAHHGTTHPRHGIRSIAASRLAQLDRDELMTPSAATMFSDMAIRRPVQGATSSPGTGWGGTQAVDYSSRAASTGVVESKNPKGCQEEAVDESSRRRGAHRRAAEC
ncbi:hypothetical protein HU200_022370 [Digitaria exilis]|uniref:Uncharacterized protein n=1 Tax=Digitaria exilis TaxID=1010633 RepID=A0A835C4L4_9POAL|nr:hypothetical protein HU200_022370 [Digitaria exilis]